eukprot:TRINITY_DN2461_c0_g1_i1.p1 TRINITY_DN2461_c0_g1~~TRINITY_DN2461_c0_g1_i1.p1  ORF type:complete len:252 (-),score=35.70 TRINITY_DN2461_c0_g1_i1:42-797(-)
MKTVVLVIFFTFIVTLLAQTPEPNDLDGPVRVPVPVWPWRWETPHAFIRDHSSEKSDTVVKDRDILSFGKLYYDYELQKMKMTFSNCPLINEFEFASEVSCDVTINGTTVFNLFHQKRFCCKLNVEEIWTKHLNPAWFVKAGAKYKGITERFNTVVHHWLSEDYKISSFIKAGINSQPPESRGLPFALELNYANDTSKHMTFLTSDPRKSDFLPEETFELDDLCKKDVVECDMNDWENIVFSKYFPYLTHQ